MTAIASAIDRGIDFLLSRRDTHGRWSDFATLAGPSTEWVSAYVAFALARTGRPPGMRAARETWSRLRRQHWWSAGWGYHSRVPSDADSTLWALLLCTAVGSKPSWRALRFLGNHVTASGAVTTFARGLPIRIFTRVARGSFAGWCGEHACVTAAAVSLRSLPHRTGALDWLRGAQLPDGHWPAYWWQSPCYTTTLATETLATERGDGDGERVERSVQWTESYVRACGDELSPFEASLALRSLLLSSQPTIERTHVLDALLAGQNDDGSWIPSARLRIPPPDMTEPDRCTQWKEGGLGGRSVQVDREGCFTAASVLLALHAAEEHGHRIAA